MTEHPSTISRRHQSLSRRIWKECATYPPLPRITITIPNFPWIIDVRATKTSYVTLEDVVDTIYASLRKTLSRSDLYAVASKLAPTDQYYAARAYEHRYGNRRSAEFYDDEKRRSLRRVDFLVGRTHFMGLVNNSRKSDQWQLNTR
ncbi:hypothetical protein BDN70DRAFT_812741 [Pholiota conissans]|uniref:DUF6699 domain-containing protein n=1 Tax=Pholiota conissans TaxID=109636 RepID=A0A9P5YW15_9AGAR|nr:hypothetical protein BDN70DRAFT_812741 [Pholiota conissans]